MHNLSFTGLRSKLIDSIEQLTYEIDHEEEITPDVAKAILDYAEVIGLVGIQIAQELHEVKLELRRANAFREAD